MLGAFVALTGLPGKPNSPLGPAGPTGPFKGKKPDLLRCTKRIFIHSKQIIDGNTNLNSSSSRQTSITLQADSI